MIFENIQIPIDALPKIETISYKSIEKKLKWFYYLRNFLFYIVLFTAVILFQLYSKKEISSQIYFIIYGVLAFAVLLSVLLIELEFPQKKYALRTHDITYKKGYLFRSVTSIPKNRIQHVEINQGILLRMLKLSRISIFTAGGTASDLSIWGLTPEDALQLKDHLSKSIANYE